MKPECNSGQGDGGCRHIQSKQSVKHSAPVAVTGRLFDRVPLNNTLIGIYRAIFVRFFQKHRHGVKIDFAKENQDGLGDQGSLIMSDFSQSV